ncbi:hypothetical protein CYY_008190 [Polysphondylium violaceum]|uniref:C2 domain-containing protein n=1 Tax=Polysphondylium violaceum TaxID=133409 RepID=A0A8J4PNZ5_9MYCE|nr:hypothetical protein CYY_008190 [Polysphondylium violaceum]
MSYNNYPGQYGAPAGGAPNLNKNSPSPGQYNLPPQQQAPPPQQQGYPPQQGGYPPQQQQGYPPQQGGYPPQQQQGYPPQQQQGYPPQQQGYGGYPPQQPQYPPQPQGYPGMNSTSYGAYSTTSTYGAYPGYPPQSYGYPAAPGYPPAPYGAPAPYPGVGVVAAPVVGVVAAPMVGEVNYILHLKGSRLDRKDVFSKSDPFVTISVPRNPLYAGKVKDSKKGGGSTANWSVVHRTETIRDNQNPVWQPFTVGLMAICGGNMEKPIKVECWDYDPNGSHDKIGSAVTTLREMQVMKEIRLVNKKRIGFGNTSGVIEILKCAPA